MNTVNRDATIVSSPSRLCAGFLDAVRAAVAVLKPRQGTYSMNVKPLPALSFPALSLAILLCCQHAGAEPPKGERVMSTRGFSRTSVLGLSEGKEAITSYRFELPYGLSAGWKLPYLGFSEGCNDTIRLKLVVVAAEQPGLPVDKIRICFSGKDDTLVPPGTVVESDPVEKALLPGTVMRVSTFYCNQAPAGPLPFMNWGYIDENIDGCLVGEIGSLKEDDVMEHTTCRGGAPPKPMWAGVNALIRAYEPMFVTGKPHPSSKGETVVIGFIGDSINISQNDFGPANPDDPYPARGWNGRFCGSQIPYVVFGQGGSNAGGFINAQKTPLFKYIFGTDAGDSKVTHLVDAYGINTLRQAVNLKFDTVWEARLQVAGICKRLGIPYVHTTLTPMTSNWLDLSKELGTPEEQFSMFVSARKKFNEKVRTQGKDIPGCIGFIDWGSAVEKNPAANENIWQSGFGTDGIHPDSAGHQRMADAVGSPFTAENPLPALGR